MDCRDDLQATVHGADCIVFMRNWIAKVRQHAIAQILGYMAFVARDELATGGLIGYHPGVVALGVELLGERCGPH
jgi:hypothetical protein